MKTKVVNIDTCINSLIRAGKKFQLNETSLSCELICDFGTFNFTANSKLKLHELGFIKMVSNHCEKLPNPKKIDRHRIKYIDINNNFKSCKNCYEIDLNQAYWELAYRNGFLSEKIYQKGKEKTISKFARLVSLGNLAKVKYHIEFDGQQYNFLGTTESSVRDIFFNSCFETSEIMQNCKHLVSENFLFYWVDAIFVNSESAKNLVCQYLESRNLPFKIKFIPEILNNENFISCKQENPEHKNKIYYKVKTDIRTPINKLLNLASKRKQLEDEERKSIVINVATKKLYNSRQSEEIVF